MTFILSMVTFFMVGYFYLHHLYLILYDITSHEHKYSIIIDKEKTNEIMALTFYKKIKLIKFRLLKIIRSDTLFDLCWPD
jgi:hypothetical protein